VVSHVPRIRVKTRHGLNNDFAERDASKIGVSGECADKVHRARPRRSQRWGAGSRPSILWIDLIDPLRMITEDVFWGPPTEAHGVIMAGQELSRNRCSCSG
jgi:hypothetical protein